MTDVNSKKKQVNTVIFAIFENSGIFLDRGFEPRLFLEGIFGKHFWENFW